MSYSCLSESVKHKVIEIVTILKALVKHLSKDSYRDGRNTPLYSKTKIGIAGVIFEPHPPNFENLYNF